MFKYLTVRNFWDGEHKSACPGADGSRAGGVRAVADYLQ